MEFRFDASDILPKQITTLDGYFLLRPKDEAVEKHHAWYESHPLWYPSNPDDRATQIVDALGEASAKAQRLQSPVTSTLKLMHSNHRMYIMRDVENTGGHTVIIGMIKVGKKQLLLENADEQYQNVTALCLLDFYVHEARQRKGHGYRLFEHMLKMEKTHPEYLAIDRPSEMLIAFLSKYYKLDGGIHQGNNYITYPGFFAQFADSSVKHLPAISHGHWESHKQVEEHFEKKESKMTFRMSEQPPQSKEEGDNTPAGSPMKWPRNSTSGECSSSWKVMGVLPPSYMSSSPQTY